jgi:hypothetical protein
MECHPAAGGKEMLNQIKNRLSKLSTRGAIVVAFLAIVGVSGIAFLLTRGGGTDAQADTTMQPVAARIDQLDGSVAIARTTADADSVNNAQPDWAEATVNTPVSIGDRIYARNNSHASIALTGHDFVRLNPEASLDVLALADRRTQLALRSGSATFDVGQLGTDELYEVATPCGSIDFAQPGLYQVGLDGDNAVISVLNGVARVVGGQGSGDINRGQVFTLACSSPSEAVASSIAPDLAGEIVDGYYRHRYAKVYDGRYRNYDTYLADPSFYDPYRTSLSCQYVTADIPGLYDLDYYGDWVNVSDYGYCWAPRVSTGWAPYHSGFWDFDDVWGPTWVASESWGWAPYHYGRWAFVSDRWFWVPEIRTRPAYCPAPVAFFSVGEQIAWVPLGPREVYVPRYYDRNFQPRYLASADVINVVTRQRNFVNFNAPGAVTVVGVNALRGTIGPGRFSTGDPNFVARSRPVLDPLSVAGVRQVAASRDDARQRIKLGRAEQEVFNRSVVAGTKVGSAPGRQDLAKALNVQAVPDNWKRGKLKINQAGEATTVRRPDGLPKPGLSSSERERQMSALATRAEQGDKSARREMRQMMREEQGATGRQTAQSPVVGQQAQSELSRQQMKQQRREERQQQVTAAAQQGASRQAQQQQTKQQQEIKQQRKVDRQQQQGAAASQQQAARQAQQQQMKRQRQVERQQQQQQMRQQQQQVRPQQQQARPQPKPPKQRPPDVQLQQQRQAMNQQQAARAQQAQRQMMNQQQAARAQQAQRQMMNQQQAARAQQAQRQAMMNQQQAARAQQAQRQAVRPQPRQGPEFMGPPIRRDQPQQRVESPRRKPPQ